MAKDKKVEPEKSEKPETPEEKQPEKEIQVEKKKKIDVKDLPGVGAATAEKLNDSGYSDMMSIAVASPGELIEAACIGELAARKIIKAARNKLDMGFESGEDLLKKRLEVIKITTGAKAVDALIGGGFETGSISEAYGQFGASKSQIAHVLAVRTQLPKEKGGANGSVIYLDGEGTFRPERIKQIAEALNLDYLQILGNIKTARCFNSDHQMLLTEKAEEYMKTGINGKPVKLIIVDSLTAHFRADFTGRGQLADRQQKLNRHMHQLMKFAIKYNVCIYVTNQVMAKPDTFFGDPTQAIGGHIVAHNSATRLYLRKGKKGSRVAKLVDSPYLADGEAIFMVADEGIVDV